MGTETYQVPFFFNRGPLIFHVWDPAGQEKQGTLRTENYQGAHCAIVMFDLTSMMTFSRLRLWFREIRDARLDIPVVLVGNKCDMGGECKVQPKRHITPFCHERNLQYFDMSVLSAHNIEKPFLWLVRKLSRDNSVVLTQGVAPWPLAPRTTAVTATTTAAAATANNSGVAATTELEDTTTTTKAAEEADATNADPLPDENDDKTNCCE